MEASDMLKELFIDLQIILNKHNAFATKEQGLIIRPKVTSSSERAHRLKQKYKRIEKQVALYKPLPVSQPGRHRLNPKFRNRVGRKAAKLRKVCNNIIQLILYVCMLYLANDETSENNGRT